MAKLLFVIAPKNYRDDELEVPKKILSEEGHSADIASTTATACKGMLGGSVKPDLTVTQALKKNYDGLIIIGGSGAPELADNADVIKLIQDYDSRQRLIASICLGPIVLAKAGVLHGVKATVWNSSSYTRPVDILKENGAKFTGDKIVTDRHIITAFGPDYVRDFAREIALYLEDNT